MRFATFIEQQTDRKDSVGEFSRLYTQVGVKLDPPTNTSGYAKWSAWVSQYGDKEAVKAFRETHKCYRQYFTKRVVSMSAYREYKMTRNPAEQEHDRLHRLRRED